MSDFQVHQLSGIDIMNVVKLESEMIKMENCASPLLALIIVNCT